MLIGCMRNHWNKQRKAGRVAGRLRRFGLWKIFHLIYNRLNGWVLDSMPYLHLLCTICTDYNLVSGHSHDVLLIYLNLWLNLEHFKEGYSLSILVLKIVTSNVQYCTYIIHVVSMICVSRDGYWIEPLQCVNMQRAFYMYVKKIWSM